MLDSTGVVSGCSIWCSDMTWREGWQGEVYVLQKEGGLERNVTAGGRCIRLYLVEDSYQKVEFV